MIGAVLARLLLALAIAAAARPAHAAGLTHPEPLVQAYELILSAKFDQAEDFLASKACPPAPAPACLVLLAVNQYWRLLLDPENTSGDAALMQHIDRAIEAADAWAAREPARAEAWFYVGGAYGTRVLLRGQRRQYLSAARDGRRIHDALQRAIKLDPSIGDAYFGLGLYHYYAAIAPRAARILSALLLLPGGDRAGGLREMEQTRSKGLLLRGEADYQLHLIYLWYERQHLTALHLIQGLYKRYPENPVMHVRLGEIQREYLRDHRAALETYRLMLDAARARRLAAPGIAEVQARLGLAEVMEEMCNWEGAAEHLRSVIAAAPKAPYAAAARAHYQLGLVLERQGRRSEAVAEYRRARAINPRDDRLRIDDRIRAAINRPLPARACR